MIPGPELFSPLRVTFGSGDRDIKHLRRQYIHYDLCYWPLVTSLGKWGNMTHTLCFICTLIHDCIQILMFCIQWSTNNTVTLWYFPGIIRMARANTVGKTFVIETDNLKRNHDRFIQVVLYLSRRNRRYSEQSCWEPTLNQGGRDASKKFLGAYAALCRKQTSTTWSNTVSYAVNWQ